MEGRSPSGEKSKKAKGKARKSSIGSFYSKPGTSKSSRWLLDDLENASDDSVDDPSYVGDAGDSGSECESLNPQVKEKGKKAIVTPKKKAKKLVSASVGSGCESVAGPSRKGATGSAKESKIIPLRNQSVIVDELLAALSDSDTNSEANDIPIESEIANVANVDVEPTIGSVDAPRSSPTAPDELVAVRPNVSGSDSDHSDEPPRKKGRRKSINVSQRFEKKNKALRNSGLRYVSAKTKKVMPARKIGMPCKDGCFEKIGMDKIKDLFDNFWAIGDYDKENDYLRDCIEERPCKRKYTKKATSQMPNLIFFKVIHSNVQYQVCRQGLLNIFGLKRRKIEWIIKKMRMAKTQTGVPLTDQRGKTRPPANKISGKAIEICHEFIQSLPVVSSHYTRAKAPLRQYLPTGGSLAGLYSEYINIMDFDHPTVVPLKENYFRKLFITNYNIDFAPPKTDECNTCAQLDIKISDPNTEDDDGEKEALQDEKKRHLADAKKAQNLMKDNSNFQEGVRSISIDLQQQQPCPKMPVNKAYYCSKLYFLNFCIYDITKNKCHMYVWDETVAKRGPNEIGSCILKWLDYVTNEEKEKINVLRIFADNCAGQNKNIFILVLLLQQIQKELVGKIELIFLVSGHSFMPCDRAFGVVEKVYRKSLYICSIPKYVEILQRACKKNKYNVVCMTQNYIYNIKELEKLVTNRSKGNLLRGKQFILSYEDKNAFVIKFHYELESIPGQELRVDLLKGRESVKGKGRGRPSELNLQMFPLQVKYTRERLLKKKKILSMETLEDMIPHAQRQWYKDFIRRQKFLLESGVTPGNEVDSDQEIDEDPDDPVNDLLEQSVLVYQ